MDRDPGKDDFAGEGNLPLSKILSTSSFDGWIELSRHEKNVGKLSVRV